MCCGAVAAHMGIVHKVSAFRRVRGRRLLGLMIGWGRQILGAGVALSLPYGTHQ